MTYEEFIEDILNTRGRFACGDKYHERHHIVPRCTGGNDDEHNLIDLFAREHFEAHRLLALENPNNDKLIYAWRMMSIMNNNDKRTYEITAEEYEEAKLFFASVASSNMSGENNIMYGKCHSEEVRKKIGEKAKIRYESQNNHPMFGKHHNEETKRIIGDKAKERYKNPEDNPMYGRHHSEAAKKQMSEAKKGVPIGPFSEEHKRKISESKKNKNGKPVVQLTLNDEFITTYITAHEAERITGIDHSMILGCCNHKPHYKTAGGFKWMSKEEYDEIYNNF